jgi:tRNA-intron endonuclease, archaea type
MSSTPAPLESEDFDIEGTIIKKCTARIDNPKARDQLRSKGFGDAEGTDYILKSYEALYLLFTKKLRLFNKGQEIDFRELTNLALKEDKEIITKFMIYRDLRSRGYVTKEGFGFGVDFRVYERGEYEKKGAKYVIFGINEGTNTNVKALAKSIRQIEIMGKEAIVAVVERRGEVIYYKTSRMKFASLNDRMKAKS